MGAMMIIKRIITQIARKHIFGGGMCATCFFAKGTKDEDAGEDEGGDTLVSIWIVAQLFRFKGLRQKHSKRFRRVSFAP